MTEPYIVGPVPLGGDTESAIAWAQGEFERIENALRVQAQQGGAQVPTFVRVTDFQPNWREWPNQSFPNTGYYLDGERVYLQGGAEATSAAGLNAPIFILPVEARPVTLQIFNALGFSSSTGETTARIDIATNGRVTLTSFGGATFGAGSWTTYNGFTYRRDATWVP